jgi:Zn-finger nucleic acid-binding protein
VAVLISETDLVCPHDGTLLRQVLFKRGKLHHCTTCFGAFLPGDVSMQVDSLKRWIDRSLSMIPGLPASKIQCPLHHGPLQVFMLGQHYLDFCAHCLGFWFDRGELKATEGPVFVASPRMTPSQDFEREGIVKDHALDIALEVGLSWLD